MNPLWSLFRSWLRSGITGLLDALQRSPEATLFGSALIVGVGTGLAAVGFRYLLQLVTEVNLEWIPAQLNGVGPGWIVVCPAVGGLLVGVLVKWTTPKVSGTGVPEVIEDVVLNGGRISPRVGVAKALASSLTIGSGGSAGREGPIVQIGATVGSAVGQLLHLSEQRLQNLVACGAASGIAATFNAPIAGVIFALEVILREFTARYFSTVVISAVAASVIGRAAFGNTPAFAIPLEYELYHYGEYFLLIGLGVLAAGTGTLFVRGLYGTSALAERWNGVPSWAMPAVGGGLLGILAMGFQWVRGAPAGEGPLLYGVGYTTIEHIFTDAFSLQLLVALLGLKLVATALTIGSGGSGGVFAPSLFLGAMLGAAFQKTLTLGFGLPLAPTGAYALLGMGGMVAATSNAPITAVLVLFELTGDYRIILPLMLTVVVATLLSHRLLDGDSIYTLKLTRRGVHLQRGRVVDIMDSVRVKDVMHTDLGRTVRPDMTIPEIVEVLRTHRHRDVPVMDDDQNLWGIVTAADLDMARESGLPSVAIAADIATSRRSLVVMYPDETMGEALARMATHGFTSLPVVSREEPRRFLGMVRRDDMLTAYRLALTRQTEYRQRIEQLRFEHPDDTTFIDIQLEVEDAAVGHTVQELGARLPQDSILVSVQHQGRVLIPHGDTVLHVGDKITAFTRQTDEETLRAVIRDGEGDDS